MADEVGESSLLFMHLVCVSAAIEDGTTELLSMSLEAFEHPLRTTPRETFSQFPLSSGVERAGPGCPPLCRPPSVSGMSRPGFGTVGSGRKLSSMLEVEPTPGELSSMPDPEVACGFGVGLSQYSRVRGAKRPSPSSSPPVLGSPNKQLARSY